MTKTMRVFVTGATGWIGAAVVKELRAAGHSVLGMAHSDVGADKLKAQGVEVYRGELKDPKSLVEGVRACDATIHLAFHVDFSDFPKIDKIDRAAITALNSRASNAATRTRLGWNPEQPGRLEDMRAHYF